MNHSENPSPARIAVQGWMDMIRAIRQMPLIFGMAISGLVIVQVVLDRILPTPPDVGLLTYYARSLVEIVATSFLLAPLAIAMHRFVLLNEIGLSYSFSFRDLRFAKFFAAELAYSAFFVLPVSAMTIIMKLFGKTHTIVLIGCIAVIVVTIFFALRALILFPAIAMDAAGAHWRNALGDSKGHTWRIFFAVVLASLPAVATDVFYIFWTPAYNSLGHFAWVILICAEQVAVLAAMAAVASHFYRAYAQRLRQP